MIMKMKGLFFYVREGMGKNAARQMSRVIELCQKASKESNKLEKEISIYGKMHGSTKMKQGTSGILSSNLKYLYLKGRKIITQSNKNRTELKEPPSTKGVFVSS